MTEEIVKPTCEIAIGRINDFRIKKIMNMDDTLSIIINTLDGKKIDIYITPKDLVRVLNTYSEESTPLGWFDR